MAPAGAKPGDFDFDLKSTTSDHPFSAAERMI